MAHFQVKLGGDWQNYSSAEDKILKRAFMAGFPNAKFHHRSQHYVYDFRRMVQINTDTRKERQIRAPRNWKAPSKPLVPAGPTTVITVPPGSPGTTIQVPHPGVKGAYIAVKVPRNAKVGQAMLVPVPSEAAVTATGSPVKGDKKSSVASAGTADKKSSGWSTGAKVAAGTAAVAGAGALAVGGVVLGDSIAEHGVDGTIDAIGDSFADAGEVIGDFAVDAGEFVVDAAEDVGDFIMDLF